MISTDIWLFSSANSICTDLSVRFNKVIEEYLALGANVEGGH